MILSRVLQVQKIAWIFLYVFFQSNLMFACLESKIERQLRGPEPEVFFVRVFTYKNAFFHFFLVFLIVFFIFLITLHARARRGMILLTPLVR